MLVDGVLDRLADPFADLLFEIGALEDFAALAVDNLALLVHDVVVLDQITAGGGVLPLPPGLGAPPLSRDQPRPARRPARGARSRVLHPLRVPPRHTEHAGA